MFAELTERIFWNLYAICYDSISKLTPYQKMQEIILEQSALNSSNMTLLDAGCGSGNFLRLVSQRNILPIVTAIDASTVMITKAQQKCKNSKIHWMQLDLNAALPFQDSSFDRIVCTNVLFALQDPKKTVAEFYRVLKPEGRLVIATPKGEFNTNKIFKTHLQSLKSWQEWAALFPLMLPLGLATLCNIIGKQKSKQQIYHFFNAEKLQELISSTCFDQITLTSTYAGQDWLVVATKSAYQQSNTYKSAAQDNGYFDVKEEKICTTIS